MILVPFSFVLPKNLEQLEINIFIPFVSCYTGVSNLRWLVSVRRWLIHWHHGFSLLCKSIVAIRVKIFPHLARQRSLGILVPFIPWCSQGQDDNVCFGLCQAAWCLVSRFKSIRGWGVWIYCRLSRAHICRKVKDTIIESEEKVDDIDYSVCFKRATVFYIYISSNIGVCTVYLLDSPSIQLAQFHPWLSSACSVLRHSMMIAILIQVRAEANYLATPRYTIN